jgi:tyrocidine synthetase-3
VYEGDIRESLTGKILPENRVGAVKLTPSHLKLIMEQKGNHLRSSGEKMKSNIKRFIVGGETLETKLAREIVETFHETPAIYNEYGPTEATVGCMIYEFSPGTDIRQSVPIGIPADNVYIYLLDKNKKPVPLGIVGEVHISGDGVARGYLNWPELTDEKFIDNPFAAGKRMYKSNDLARFLTDGNVEFLGRIDHQVKIRGLRIEVGEIENRLLNHKDIKNAIVIPEENEKRGKYLCVYIISERSFEVSELREFLSKELPDYMIPSSFMQVEKIPLTPSGKVNRQALALMGKRLPSGTTYVAPQDAIEKKIADIWKEALLVEKVGIHDNYFDLGGTSFDIIRINAKLNESLQVNIPVIAMFRYTTVASLAGHLKSEETHIQGRASALTRGRQAKIQMSQRRRRVINV